MNKAKMKIISFEENDIVTSSVFSGLYLGNIFINDNLRKDETLYSATGKEEIAGSPLVGTIDKMYTASTYNNPISWNTIANKLGVTDGVVNTTESISNLLPGAQFYAQKQLYDEQDDLEIINFDVDGDLNLIGAVSSPLTLETVMNSSVGEESDSAKRGIVLNSILGNNESITLTEDNWNTLLNSGLWTKEQVESRMSRKLKAYGQDEDCIVTGITRSGAGLSYIYKREDNGTFSKGVYTRYIEISNAYYSTEVNNTNGTVGKTSVDLADLFKTALWTAEYTYETKAGSSEYQLYDKKTGEKTDSENGIKKITGIQFNQQDQTYMVNTQKGTITQNPAPSPTPAE